MDLTFAIDTLGLDARHCAHDGKDDSRESHIVQVLGLKLIIAGYNMKS